MISAGSDSLRIDYPAELPVSARREEIAATISANQVLILCGETGSGKTTQLPKICIEIGRGRNALIGHTQPRRLAARSVAARLAEETATSPGRQIAYKIRFTDQTGPDCRIKLMTDGVLLQEVVHDRELRRYDTLIIDEAHERSINIDFLLGYLRTLLPRRPDLHVVITSATIDPGCFSRHFGDAPIIEVSGRTHPVELRYRPTGGEDDFIGGILDGIDELLRDTLVGRGDILVFLPGERDIRDTAKAVRQRFGNRLAVLPLFARLAPHEQDKVYKPGPQQRVVLATNVAETSLTVPRIASVIDTGLARISRYSASSKIQQLPIEPISRASADQRKGRCGRLGPGVCLRLYTEEDFEQRPAFTDPEIVRTSLAGVLLRMSVLGLGDVEDFPFPDAPDNRLIRDARRLLRELGAMEDETLTPLGHRLAGLSVDPRIGRMLLAAGEHACLREMLVIAAGLSIPDPQHRDWRPEDDEPVAWRDGKSEFNGLLKLWEAFHLQQKESSGSQLRKWCKRNGLSFLRMREWQDLHRQLREQTHRLRLPANRQPASTAELHQAILTGLLSHIGQREESDRYRGARGLSFRLSSGSPLRDKPPQWVVAASIVHTHRAFASRLAVVKAGWIERAGAHLLQKTHGEPRWDKRRQAVVARETVKLYGLTLNARRMVDYSAIDPERARSIFIRDGLVGGGHNSRSAYAVHNQGLAKRLREDAARLRRADIMPDSVAQCRFFESRLSVRCTGPAEFERWRRKAESRDPQVLFMDRDDLTAALDTQVDATAYPDHMEICGNRFALRYRFSPGDDDDGVSIVAPVAAVKTLRQQRIDWLVPGMIKDKVTAVVRGLPKAIRRRLVPAPQRAEEFVAAAANNPERPFYTQLAGFLTRAAGQPVSAADCAAVALDDWLRLRVELVDSQGATVAAARSLAAATEGLGAVVHRALALNEDERWNRSGIREWDFGELPEELVIDRQGVSVTVWPGLEDEEGSVRLRLYDNLVPARRHSRNGVVRLLALRLPQQAKMIAARLRRDHNMALLSRAAGGLDLLCDQVVTTAIRETMLGDALPRDATSFGAIVDTHRAALVPAGEALADIVAQLLERAHQIRIALEELPTEAADDIRSQLEHLVFPGFVSLMPSAQLREYPRYLQAVAKRIENLRQGDKLRDGRHASDVAVYWQQWLTLEQQRGGEVYHDPNAMEFRFLIEEYRVSLFAQQLGTRGRASPKRLEQAWRTLQGEGTGHRF